MGARFKFDFLDLGGGHVDGIPATHIENNQFAELKNFYTYGPKIVRRGGTLQVTNEEFDDTLTTVFTFKDNSTDSYKVIVGGLSSLGFLDGQMISEIGTNFILGSEDMPWHFRQFYNTVYAVRENSGSLMRGDTDAFLTAGIAGPLTAPTLADGAAGSVLAGNYYGVVVFKNSRTAQRSNPSTASAVYAAPGSKKIAWSAIPTSTNAQVDSRELYRTYKDQTGIYYLVATIADNITTTYSEDDATADNEGYGRQATTDNELPPNNLEGLEAWVERVFVHDGDTLYFSAYRQPESFPTDNTIQISADDGHKIRALLAISEKRMIVGKTRGIYYLTPAGNNKFDVKVMDDKRGVIAAHSMKSAEGMLFWYDGEDFLKSEGGPGIPMADFRIREILNNIPDERKKLVTATVYPKLHWYVATVPQDEGEDLTLVYSYRDDAWAIFEYHESPTFVGDFFDENYQHILYGLFGDGHLYQLHSEDVFTDWGTPYPSVWKGKELDGGRPGLQLAPDRVSILCSSVPHELGDVEMYYYRNGSSTPRVTRDDVYLYDPDKRWKTYRIAGQAFPGDTIQIGMNITVEHAFEMSGIIVEGALADRMNSATVAGVA